MEDLEKAKWYIDRAISIRKTKFPKTPNQMADVKHYESSADNVGRFLFASREEANKVVKELQSMIHEHGYVTLADLHDMCELAVPSPDCEDVGWKNAGDFRIIPTAYGWELTFYMWPETIKHN